MSESRHQVFDDERRLQVVEEGGTVHLILNRPDQRNALSAELVEDMIREARQAFRNEACLLVLSGNGRNFCAGFDLTGVADASDAELAYRLIRIELLLQLVHHAPIPVLVLAHGSVYGAGADLVVAASHRVAAPQSKFRMPGLGFQVVLGTGRLARLVGADTARNLLLELKTFDAGDALSMGLVGSLREQADWPEVIEDVARSAGVLPRASVRSLFSGTSTSFADRDLGNLVRSVAEPGLRERIAGFLASERRR